MGLLMAASRVALRVVNASSMPSLGILEALI